MTEQETSHWTFWTRCAGSTSRDRSNLRRVMWTYLAWAVLFTGGSQLIEHGLVPSGPAAWALVGSTIFLAVFVVLAYGRFLREADELRRVIHLEGMALGFGGGFVGVCCYRMAERVGAPHADIADATLVLVAFFVAGIIRSTWRYR